MNSNEKRLPEEEVETSSSSAFNSSKPTTTTQNNITNISSGEIIFSPLEEKSNNHNLNDSNEMKRAAAKKLIERYFYQLREGCGNPLCNNKNCKNSGEVNETMTPNEAAAKAIQLYSEDAELCERQQPSTEKKARTMVAGCSSSCTNDLSSDDNKPTTSTTTSIPNSSIFPQTSKSSQNCDDHQQKETTTENTNNVKTATKPTTPPTIDSIDEDEIVRLIEVCHLENSYSLLIRTLGSVFSSRESVLKSFKKKQCSSILGMMLEKTPGDLKGLKKEDIRTLEGDLDKDEDSCIDKTVELDVSNNTDVDLVSLRRAMTKLYEDNSSIFEPLNTAIQSLAMSIDSRLYSQTSQIEEIITVFVIIFEIFNIAKVQFLEIALPNICTAATYLPIWAQARLARIWAEHSKSNLENLLEMFQQLITLQVMSGEFYRECYVQDNEVIVNATKVMKIVYYASILAGVLEPKNRDIELELSASALDEELFQYSSKNSKSTYVEDPLAVELAVDTLECRKPYIPFDSFYNETLSEIIEMDKDYLNYKQMNGTGKPFSFMLYSFILTPATKTLSLYFDNRIRMYSERRISIFHTQFAGQPANPYLKLRVRRDKLIDDALVELELVAMGNPKDLKKQLYVEFLGEQGLDEGGVSKEFFQLVVYQIFNPDYGMFIQQEDTNTVWFNSTSFENDAQFTLIGIVLGLAIYNNIILAVNFPMVVYRKLMGLRGSFADLEDLNPVLYNSLKSMLEYQELDMEDVFMQTFQINYPDIFGNILHHELKSNGDNVFVSQENKQEFVDLYADFLLNSSVEKQFLAFKRGFQMVTDESPLQLLFRPEEIELLVCGSKDFDFNELENAAEYEGGYTSESQSILDFWTVVHALSLESKKKLLEFTTGSDRVPVGGLSKLKLVIARNGPDCDRLPTSHTCFNVLLLPEYSSKDKLEERLLKAINYSKGFGMI